MKRVKSFICLSILTATMIFPQDGSSPKLNDPINARNFSGRITETIDDTLDTQIMKRAQAIAGRIGIIDCHNHNLFQPASEKKPKQVSYSMLKKGGVKGIVQSFPLDNSSITNPPEDILKNIVDTKKKIENDGMNISVVLKSNDLSSIGNNDSVSVIIGLEFFRGIFNGSIELVQRYYDAGVREIGLVRIGGVDTVYNNNDLTEFGRGLIDELNRLGIIVDITHLSGAAQKKIIDYSRAPVILSHTAAHSVVNSGFNAKDSTLEKLKSKEGIICLGFYSGQLSNNALAQLNKGVEIAQLKRASIEELVDHIDYLKTKLGIDYVGIGSDYGGSGQMSPDGLETVDGFPLIIYHMLKRGYSENEIEKIMGLNFIRFFERVEKKAASK